MEKQLKEIIAAVNQLMLSVNKRMQKCKSAQEMKASLDMMNQLLDIQTRLNNLLPAPQVNITVTPTNPYVAPPLPADTVIALYMVITEPWVPSIEGTYAYAAPFGPIKRR